MLISGTLQTSPASNIPQPGQGLNTEGLRRGQQFTEEELALIASLKKRDREVRAHEQAHSAAAGPYGSAPKFTYQRGPDGKNYAVGGHVNIDTSPIPGDPQATLQKAETIRAAANAPASPSSQDRAVAADAAAMAVKARMELAKQDSDSQQESALPGSDLADNNRRQLENYQQDNYRQDSSRANLLDVVI